MAIALYRKYRSRSLEEIIGQPHITETLKRALSAGRLSHAYLLTGPRGVGKTSVARIMAHEINHLPYSDTGQLDIIEIDAASNNGVDDVRDLRDKAVIAPVSLNKKIYIIDEVHMLSKPAFNALLKTLEEPPDHVVFILATTEVHKLPDTILSRTQRFHFRPIAPAAMKKHLRHVAKAEKISFTEGALTVIAERSEGSFRDAISLLDQLSNLSHREITAAMIEEALGLAPTEQLSLLVDAIIDRQIDKAINQLSSLEESGVSSVVLSQQLSQILKPLVTKHPDLIHLLDQLIEVGRSFNPQLKLLATVALAANTGSSTASVYPPKSVGAQASKNSITLKPHSEAKKPAPTKTSQLATADAVQWPEVLSYVRQAHPPLYGVIKNASATNDGTALKLHFNFLLHKKKLDEGKYRQLLLDSLNALYKNIPEIILSSGKLPFKSQSAQTVANVMGGGEEVGLP